PRFTHTFVIHEAAAFPKRHQGKLFSVAPLQSHVMESEVLPHGSSFQTKDIGPAVTTSDPWFRPVDIKPGPDGALYVADFYESQIAHLRHFEGVIHTDSGRVYPLRARDAKPSRPVEMGTLTPPELIKLLESDNRWTRQTALRVIGDRKDRAAIPLLTKLLKENTGQLALEALWALNLSGGFNGEIMPLALAHANSYVRLWAV